MAKTLEDAKTRLSALEMARDALPRQASVYPQKPLPLDQLPPIQATDLSDAFS